LSKALSKVRSKETGEHGMSKCGKDAEYVSHTAASAPSSFRKTRPGGHASETDLFSNMPEPRRTFSTSYPVREF
jgi:hypothetical protein